MTDISITAANVKSGSNAHVVQGVAGTTITAGQVVHRNAAGKFILSDNDGAGLQKVDGIALNGAAEGQPLSVQTAGDITIGATLTAGTAYYLSGTAGGICPRADVTTGDEVILIGLATSASVMTLKIVDTNVELEA